MKTRFWIIVALGIIGIIVVAGLVSTATPSTKKAKESETVTITINYNVGIKTVDVIIQNTGQQYTATVTSLPYSFNVTRGSAIDIIVTTTSSYTWNAWTFKPVGIPFSDNPGTFKADNTNYFGSIVVNNQIIMEPNCRHVSASISPTPTPSPTPIE
jgi:hypothetical protein